MPSLSQDKTTKIWKVRDRRGGRDREQSLGTKDKAVAERRYGQWLAENGGDKWREVQHTFNEAVEKMMAEHLATKRPNTVRSYMTHLLSLTPHFEGRRLSEIGRSELYAYEQARRQSGVQPSTILIEMRVLSLVYGCAQESEWVEINPVPAYLKARAKKGLTKGEPQTRYLSLAEEQALLQTARSLPVGLYPDRDMIVAAIILSIDTGLRSDELFGLPWSDVDLVRKEITVKANRAKSGKERRVPILPRAEKVLRGLQRHYASPYVLHRPDGARYQSMRPVMRKLVLFAELSPARWHDLRRTCGCRLLQVHKLQMHAVAQWLGHSSSVITESTYAFLRVDDLHDAVGTQRGVSDDIQTVEIGETINKINYLRDTS